VTLDANGGEVYALLSFDTRCAQIFEAEKPLGTVWFRDRADSLFGLIRSTLPNDSALAAMALPDTASERSTESISAGSYVEVLPEVVTKVPPRYPNEAVLAARSGTVWIQALVGPDGAVQDALVRRSVRGLDDAALDAVWQWKFRPAMSGGFPIAVWVMIPVTFTLK
jgi:TonB family protein